MALLLVVGFWLLFALPALVASRRARRLDPRPDSLLAPTVRLAGSRLVIVLIVLVAQSLVVLAIPRGDYIERGSMLLVGVGMVVTIIACLLLAGGFVRGLLVAVRIGRAVARVRKDADVGVIPAARPPAIDFGVGNAAWVFHPRRAAGYREAASSPEWARGTLPPVWAAFVGPALDLLYVLAFLLIVGFDMMLTLGD